MKMRGTFLGIDIRLNANLLRLQILNRSRWFPEPASLLNIATNPEEISSCFEQVKDVLKTFGAMRINLERTLTNQEFIRFGTLLGDLIPERAQAVRQYVEDEFVLNTKQELAETEDIDLQPFAENYITLHTEMSLSPILEQPRFIVLMCEQAPAPNTGGQTILASMGDVYERLLPVDKNILRHTHYQQGRGQDSSPYETRLPAFLFSRNNRPVFSFRDFNNQPLEWYYDGEEQDSGTSQRVNESLYRLLMAMYDRRKVQGIHWKYGTLFVIDNTFFFHGKSYCRIRPGTPPRWLKRLRIRA